MIVGLGIDTVDIARVREAMRRRPRFAERILTPGERALGSSAEFVAGRWAAKEAIYKAVGLPLTWQQVEVLPDELGVPKVRISSPSFDPGRLHLHVSITHERTHATAVAVIDRVVYQAPNFC